jgi:DedD protein
MKWAFWRRRKPRATDPGRTDARLSGSDEAAADEAGGRTGQAARLRVRMRRRLIGAAALLLGTAVVVPMMLDRAPPPLPDNIPIDIPSERTPFTPRLSLPSSALRAPEGGPSSAPGAGAVENSSTGSAAPHAAAGTSARDSASQPAEARSAKADVGEPSAPAAPGASADSKAGSAAVARSAKAGWFVQAAALSNETAAGQLSERLSKGGLTPFVERTEAAGTVLYRVRLGPFGTRDAAVKAGGQLRAMGVDSNVVRVEQAQR